MTTTPSHPEPAVSVCFAVTIDDMQLGVQQLRGPGRRGGCSSSGGGRQQRLRLAAPTRLKFTNIQADPAVCSDTSEVMAWLSSMSTGFTPKTANISAPTAERTVVASWGCSA